MFLIVFGFLGRAAIAQDQAAEIRELKQRVVELERQKSAAPAAAPKEEAPKAAEAPPSWKELSLLGGRFRFYGFLRVDAQFDTSRANNTQTIGWILSEDPAAPAGVGAGGKNKEDFTLHPRLTRFGFDFMGGKVESLGDAEVTGKIEVDFYNSGLSGQSESRAALRMRHAWMKLAWGQFSILGGQTNDVISPLFPIVNADLVMWGAGNLGDRRPQLRFEHAPAAAETGFIAQGEIGLTGANDNSDLDAPSTFGAGYRDGETSGKPTLQLRLADRFEIGGQKAEVGVWAHRAWEEPDTAFNGEDEFKSYALGFDVSAPLWKDIVGLKLEGWAGENVDDVRGGIFQGINKTKGEEIASKGGFLELSCKLGERTTAYVGYSTDDPDNDDVGAQGRAANKIWYAALRWNFKPVSFGLEYLDWTTNYVGLDDGTNQRFGAFMQYSF
ncbi:MAG: hypothetical protein JNL28_02085 [Planctomycetes bacterium]|nr:hypothetical protein [Planctomycetota bacterium]